MAQIGAAHPLRGRELDVAGVPGRRYESVLSIEQPWFAGQHGLFGTPALPAAAAIEWAYSRIFWQPMPPSLHKS